jgi:hypothetical protein
MSRQGKATAVERPEFRSGHPAKRPLSLCDINILYPIQLRTLAYYKATSLPITLHSNGPSQIRPAENNML